MSTESNDLTMYHAYNATGEPVCVSDLTENPNSLSVSLYQDDDGFLVGVIVFDTEGNLQAASGLLPAEVVEEERRYLGYDAVEGFLPASDIGLSE